MEGPRFAHGLMSVCVVSTFRHHGSAAVHICSHLYKFLCGHGFSIPWGSVWEWDWRITRCLCVHFSGELSAPPWFSLPGHAQASRCCTPSWHLLSKIVSTALLPLDSFDLWTCPTGVYSQATASNSLQTILSVGRAPDFAHSRLICSIWHKMYRDCHLHLFL